jgi:segregation and condensation protein B
LDILKQHVESLIFCSSEPISLEKIISCLSEILQRELLDQEIISVLDNLQLKYEEEDFSFKLRQLAGDYEFLTKLSYQASVGTLLKQKSEK